MRGAASEPAAEAHHSLRRWVASGALASLAVTTAAALLSIFLRQQSINNWEGGGCAFPDGVSYCAMAAGEPGARPFSQRPLVPFLARIVGSVSGRTVIESFAAVALAGFGLTVVAIAALGWVVAQRMGVSRRRTAHALTLAALSWSLTPFALRFVMTAPVLTDELATGLTIAWLALLLAPRHGPFTWTLAPAAAMLAITAREMAFATIAATCVFAVALRILSRREALANGAAAVLALVFDLTRPTTSSLYNAASEWAYWFDLAIHNPHAVLTALSMGVGFAMVALLPTLWARIVTSLNEARWLCVLLPAALLPIFLATFVGQDLARLSSPAAPVLCLVLAFYVVVLADLAQIVLVALIAAIFVAEWGVFTVNGRSWWGYMVYFYGMKAFRWPVLSALGTLAAALVFLDLLHLRRRRVASGPR